MRNVDDCWSLQARGADPDLHGNGAHLHGAGNGGGYKQTLVEMVILAPAKCMHKTHIYWVVLIVCFNGCAAGMIHLSLHCP